jgi:hypothetical protein
MSDLLPSAGSALAVVEKLQECVRVAESLMKHARMPDGAIRNSGLLLKASEHLRRTLETAARLQEAMMQVSQVERFHSLIIAEVAKESPEAAERILAAVGGLADSWGG